MRKIIGRTVVSVLAAVSSPAWTQDVQNQSSTQPDAEQEAAGSPSSLEEVIVTAERRAQRLESVPLSITAVTGQALEQNQVLRTLDLPAQVPGLTVVQARLGSFKIAIRGIGGSAGDNIASNLKVATFMDDIYLARQGAMDAALFDLDRIEVLRGPQGTLYGKNAVAGAINIVSALPSDTFHAKVAVDSGNYDTLNTRMLVSGPLAEDLTGKLVVGNNYHSGYGKNLTTGRELSAGEAYFGRGMIRYTPGDWDLILSGDYEKDPTQAGRPFHIFGTGVRVLGRGPYFGPNGVHDVYNDLDNRSSLELGGGSFKAIRNGADLTFTSISGYRWSDRRYQLDLDNSDSALTGANFQQSQRQHSSTFSQEFRLSSTEGGGATLDGRLFWNLGAYFFYEDGNTTELNLIPVRSPIVNTLTTDLEASNYAGYGQATYNLTDKLSLTAGMRYNWEEKKVVHGSFGAPVQTDELYSDIHISDTWTNTSPKFTVDYKIGGEGTIYATYARGFLSGAINSGPATAQLAATEVINPELDDNYEIGIKQLLFDRRLSYSLAVYYIEYTDLQVQVANQQGQAVTRNAAEATSKGFELELHARPLDSLQVDLTYAYTNARYDAYCAGTTNGFLTGDACVAAGGTDNSGQRLQYYSPNVFHGALEYTFPMVSRGELSLRGDYTYNSHSTFPGYHQDGYGLYNAALQYVTDDGRWTMAAWGRNLADEKYATGCLNLGRTSNGGQCSVGDPRTYGVTVTWSYE